MLALSVLAALSFSTELRIDVWKPNLAVKDLAAILSKGDLRFSADQEVASRRVHVFVRRQQPLEIAQMTAKTLGLTLVKVNNNWRFEPDRDYDRIMRGHAADVAT